MIKKNVAIVGCYQSGYVAADEGNSLSEIAFNCSRAILDKYKLERNDLDLIVIACDDLLDGRSISSMVTAAPAGAILKEFVKVPGDGTFALAYAYQCIQAGFGDLILVSSWSTVSEAPYHNITKLTFDPFYMRPFFDGISSKGMQASRYVSKYSISDRQAAMVAVKNRSNGAANPLAHLRKKVTMEEVLSSELLSYPIRKLEDCTLSDGACAVLLASPKLAASFEKAVSIRGIGWDTDSYSMGDRDLGEIPSLRNAAKRAYAMASIKDPSTEINVAEVSDISSYHELMIYEGLGLCGVGEGGRFMEAGYTQLGGNLPVNPSGGLISSNPTSAAGLDRVVECYKQLCADAGAGQVKNACVALAHGIQGNASQQNCVVIMER